MNQRGKSMPGTPTIFDRDKVARQYAAQHLRTDPGIRAVYYLPNTAPEREIRLVEVNELIGAMAAPEPLDFGVDISGPEEHTLFVLDVTPQQWEQLRTGSLPLPQGWTLDNAVRFER
jgi:hypothetical protein